MLCQLEMPLNGQILQVDVNIFQEDNQKTDVKILMKEGRGAVK